MTNNDILKRQMLEALEKTLGVVTGACKKVGISRETHYRWLREDEAYKVAVNSIEDVALDFAESQLHLQIQNGEVSSTIFYLKTKGKKRGYIERAELEHSGEFTTNTTIKWGDKEIKI
jgi:ACT domain-containing protein